MPIIQDSAPLIYPTNDYVVVKYMDLTKFLSLLQRNELFFCRQDKLEDTFEGQTAKRNYEWRIKSLQSLNDSGFLDKKMTETEIKESIAIHYEFERKLKSIRLINCWNKKNQESAALWKIYSDYGKGIMIKSSIDRIKNAFLKCNQEIRISEVDYINYDTDLMADGNDFFLICHKQDAYSYEDEVRLIHEVTQGVENWKYDWDKEITPNGKYFTVDLEELIEEIIVGPYCPKWQFDLIKDISGKYNLTKGIKKSKLTASN